MVNSARWRLRIACGAAIALTACGISAPRTAAQVLDPWATNGPSVPQLTTLPPIDHEGTPMMLVPEPLLAVEPVQPRLSASLGAVLLQRARPRSELFFYNPNTGASILDPYDLVFPFRGGVDAGLLWRGIVADVDFRYFGVEQWNASYGPVTASAGQLNIPGDEPFDDPLGARLFGSTSLHSFEVNLRRNVTDRWTWLAGFRYVSFRDAMGLQGGDPPLENFATAVFGTTNHLFGLQIGADAIVWQTGERFRVESAIKAGVYANGARSSLTVHDPEEGEEIQLRMGRDHTAFVGDLNFVGIYQINPRWAVRAGYQLVWLSGVAAGSMQFLDMDLETPSFRTNTSATVFFHGALVGIERNW